MSKELLTSIEAAILQQTGMSVDEIRERNERAIQEQAKEAANGKSLDEMRQAFIDYANKKNRTGVTITDLSGAAKPERKRELALNAATYADARKTVIEIMEERAYKKSRLIGREFKYDFTGIGDTIKDLIHYFVNSDEGGLDLSKGLFIHGVPGTGKTEIMQVMQEMTSRVNLRSQFNLESLSIMYDRARGSETYNPIPDAIQLNKCFDEFGRHTGAVMRFGNPLNITETLIEQRYIRHEASGQKTHFISNFSPDEAMQMLSPAIRDRLKKMCQSVKFGEKSHRQ
jgi:DNA replication protein DnaC